MSVNDWTDDRLTRAALGSLLRFSAAPVLKLAAEVGPAEAWQRLKAGCPDGGASAAAGQGASTDEPTESGREPARVNDTPGGEAFAAWAASIVPECVAQQTEQAGLRFLIPGDAEWPVDLADLEVCSVSRMGGVPVGLWVGGAGHLSDWTRDAVAMVGSRAATRYGESIAMRMASELAGDPELAPVTVVSGGAFGIDAASHRGALLVNGPTVGVFANGLDQPYPLGNSALVASLRQHGLLVSELPPGATPTKAGFLQRNRIIAALSQGTVVVEAALRSGARNTASWAGAMGRVVMAVPGPVTSAMSVTPHNLIRDGEAVLVASSDDVRALVRPIGETSEPDGLGPSRPLDDLGGDAVVVHEALPSRGAMTLSEVVLASGVPVQRCLDALGKLARRGLAKMDEQGRWRVRRVVAEG